MEFRTINRDELASVVKTVVDGCSDVPYFAEKKPEFLVDHWLKIMGTGLSREYAAFVGGTAVGVLLGIITPDFMTGLNQAHEALWQVIPEHRKTGAGLRLLKMFEEEAKKEGCARIVFGASTEQNFEPMQRLYRKLGYTPFSMTMGKRL